MCKPSVIKMDTKYRITRGYFKIAFTKIKEGGTKEKEEGGFVEDWLHGHLWVFFKIEDGVETGLATSFELVNLESKIDEILKEESKPEEKKDGKE